MPRTRNRTLGVDGVLLAGCLCSLPLATPTSARQELVAARQERDPDERLREASNLHNRSRYFYDFGRYEEALAAIEEARAIIEEVKGKHDPLVTLMLNDSAYYYAAKGELAPVAGILKEVVAREQAAHGERSLQAVLAQERLADHYIERGLEEQAGALYSQLAALVDPDADEHAGAPHLARIRGKLGSFHARRGELELAQSHHRAALALAEQTFGEGHLETGKFLNDLALFYGSRREQYAQAEVLYKRLLAIIEPALGPSQRVWTVKQNLGMLYLRSGRYPLALDLLKERYEEERADPFLEEMGSPKLAISASNLGELYWAMGELERALPLWIEAGERSARFENATLAIGSEQERLQYAAGQVDSLDAAVSMHLGGAPDDALAAEMALLRILRSKGRVLEAQADTFRLVRESLSPELTRMLRRIGELRGSLAYLEFTGEAPELQREQLEEIEESERELAGHSAALLDINRLVTLEDVRLGLPEDAALIEFLRYRPFDVRTRALAEAHYAAYGLGRSGAPFGIDLGPAADIDARVDALRRKLEERGPEAELASALFRTLVGPWLGRLEGCRHLILAPDGELCLLPFELLAGPEGKRLIETHLLTYQTSGRDLIAREAPGPSRGAAVLVADPAYGTGVEEQADAGSGPMAGVHWPQLPGTAAEADAIGALFEEARILRGEQASESALKSVAGPRVLHLATHGFFLDSAAGVGDAPARGLVVSGDETQLRLRQRWRREGNPLLRCGLVLAGANESGARAQDGYLTAFEAIDLDLRGTQLVVMSACETGLGQASSGEGVFGLRRAMDLAGAQAQVMSLWRVSDEATTELMRRFYSKLSEGLGRGEALRSARLELAASARWAHPYFWGAFVLAGDWSALR